MKRLCDAPADESEDRQDLLLFTLYDNIQRDGRKRQCLTETLVQPSEHNKALVASQHCSNLPLGQQRWAQSRSCFIDLFASCLLGSYSISYIRS